MHLATTSRPGWRAFPCATALPISHEPSNRYFQLGRTYKLLGDTAKSLDHYNKYLQLCKDIDDKVGEGQACSALASAHEAAGELSKATSFLEIFYELSQMTGELASQEEACTRLGKIYFQTEDYNNSVRYFEKVRRAARRLQLCTARLSDICVSKVFIFIFS